MTRMKTKSAVVVAAISSMFVASPAMAATNVIVSPSQPMGWTQYVRDEGGVTYVKDTSTPSPYNDGALQLTTADTVSSVGQYSKNVSVKLADAGDVSYMTKTIQGFQPTEAELIDFPDASASYSLTLDLNGDGQGDTSLVYEPYNQKLNDPGAQQVERDVWQTWNVRDGYFWSSKSYEGANLTLQAGAGGAPFYTIDQVLEAYPDATVTAISVYAGSYNPGYQVNVDGVVFGDVAYNFEQHVARDVAKEQCKNGGYKTMKTESGGEFKNQGQCVSYYAKQQR